MKKQVSPIGQQLHLVEGTARWAIYDFQKFDIYRINPEIGDILLKLYQCQTIKREVKIDLLKNRFPVIFDKIQSINLSDRLFNINDCKEYYATKEDSINSIWIEITNKCNLLCRHCYSDSSASSDVMLHADEVIDILDQANNLKIPYITIIGGEPFMHKDLWKIVKFAKTKCSFHEIEIFTNLTMINNYDVELLKEYDIKIATTILGHTDKIHDNCTQKTGSFEKWFSNIKLIQKNDIEFRIAVIRMQENQNVISEIEAFLREHGLLNNDIFQVDDVRPTGRAKITDTDVASDRSRYDLYLTVNHDYFVNALNYNTCWAGKFVVSSAGEIYPCIFSRELASGNIREMSLAKIIDSLKSTYWKITKNDIEKCSDCEFRLACFDCRALSLNSGAGLYGKPIRCDYNPYTGNLTDIRINIYTDSM